MEKIISFIGIAGFIISLLLMYTTDLGERGLRKYDTNFKTLDMRFHYTADDINEVFKNLGEEGRAAYQNFWILDFVFIACFLIVMLTIVNKIEMMDSIKNILIALSIARAGFDIIENSFLMYLSNVYPVHNNTLATAAAWATTCKFVSLYGWILGIAVMGIYPLLRGKGGN